MHWKSELPETKKARLGEWHSWFAWRPVRIGEYVYWLEVVKRKRVQRLVCNYFDELYLRNEYFYAVEAPK